MVPVSVGDTFTGRDAGRATVIGKNVQTVPPSHNPPTALLAHRALNRRAFKPILHGNLRARQIREVLDDGVTIDAIDAECLIVQLCRRCLHVDRSRSVAEGRVDNRGIAINRAVVAVRREIRDCAIVEVPITQ